MTRNWGIPSKDGAFGKARDAKPLATMAATIAFGVLAASLAAFSFIEARTFLTGLFRGPSLITAVVAAGFGCWAYVWLAWPRFAAQFSGGDAFSDLIRFYGRAAIGLVALLAFGNALRMFAGLGPAGLALCVSGGAAAAAAFQTVLPFVPARSAEGPGTGRSR